MSKARPKSKGRRIGNYYAQNTIRGAKGANRGWFGDITPRQRRRINHKLNRAGRVEDDG